MSKEKRRVPKLRFPGFTEDWEQRKLGDVIDSLYNGQTPSRFDKANWEGDIPWLTSGELNRGVVNHSIEKITQQGRDDANLKIVPKGTVVIAITGLEAAGTRGNCAKLGFDTTLNQSCMAIYPKSEFLDPDFLFQWYIAVGEEYGIKYTQGTKQQSYNAELIKILPISVPRVTEQRKITRILDSFDDIITLHQRKLEHLNLKKKALLQKLFPKNGARYPELRFPGFTDAWEQHKLSEVVTINPKTELPDEFKYVDLESVVGTNLLGFQVVKKENAPSRAQRLASYGDVFYQTVRPYQRNNYLFENVDKNMVFSTGYAQLRSKLDSYFLLTLVQNDNFVKVVLDNCTGTSYPAINGSALGKITVRIPSNEVEANQIGKVFRGIDKNITLHQRKLEHLQLQKKALLQQMFV